MENNQIRLEHTSYVIPNSFFSLCDDDELSPVSRQEKPQKLPKWARLCSLLQFDHTYQKRKKNFDLKTTAHLSQFFLKNQRKKLFTQGTWN